ncbi:hypothetical protein RJ55_02875 [Drechmeria coniospora]|nr:hypothetical protein RJ55_02875 [Drechmeria coniospora]
MKGTLRSTIGLDGLPLRRTRHATNPSSLVPRPQHVRKCTERNAVAGTKILILSCLASTRRAIWHAPYSFDAVAWEWLTRGPRLVEHTRANRQAVRTGATSIVSRTSIVHRARFVWPVLALVVEEMHHHLDHDICEFVLIAFNGGPGLGVMRKMWKTCSANRMRSSRKSPTPPRAPAAARATP